MEQNLELQAQKLKQKRRRKRLRMRILGVMACVVVFCTTYALILPAITMEGETFCGIEAHTHEEACHEKTLICEEPAAEEAHEHTQDCYTCQEVLICTLEELQGHTHAEACETTESTLICTLEESEEHPHTAECYESITAITCGLEETEGHAHTDDCYGTQEALVCGQESSHVHSDDCYQEALICEMEEHTHQQSCYSNPEADVEAAADWEKTLPEQRTGEYAVDVLDVAKTQLGYTESTANFVVLEDGSIKGYSRYGAWYGDPYGDWCAMFVSFCLKYAEVTDFPIDANCQNWIQTLEALEQEAYQVDPENYHQYYASSGGYAPAPGDIIFLDWDGDSTSDHVGIVYEYIPATEHTTAQVKTIEGNSSDQVQYVLYNLDDSSILGYGRLPQQDFYCGYTGHVHQMCDSSCQMEVHIHTASCEATPQETETEVAAATLDAQVAYQAADETLYYCGFEEEHVHSGCYVNFVHTCGTIGHTHFYLCTTPPQYCSNETHHAHTAACYDENDALTCGKDANGHQRCCWINPESSGTSTDQESLYHGETRFHSSYFLKYQAGSHTVDSYETGVFALIPDSEYSDGWVPNTRIWTGDSNANYLVAYCSDDRTSASSSGADYQTYTLDNSRFTDQETQRKVAAIIGSSYPFLSSSEMRAALQSAYAAGLTVDDQGNLIDVTNTVEADWIGATQWALWNTTTAWGIHTTDGIDIDDYGDDRSAAFPTQQEYLNINPLTDPGITEVAEARTVLSAIKNWLCSLEEPVALKVESYDYTITENEDGSYKLTVTVTLNRAIVTGENTTFKLAAGSLSTELETLPVGQQILTMELDGLDGADLTGAKVHLLVDGKHMQAYFFDSENYQDMIGGNWEYYDEDLSFNVGSDLTSVTVSKVWKNGTPTDVSSVQVQLYADGTPYGDPVKLSAENSWTYTWEDLLKYSASVDGTGVEIAYTVVEDPVSGYYSSVELVGDYNGTEGSPTATIQYWKQVDTFDGEGDYVLLSQFGALAASDHKNLSDRYYMNLSPFDLTVVTEDQNKAVWTATSAGDGAGYYLQNKYFTDGYICNDSITRTQSYADAFFFEDGKFYYQSGTKKYYFRGFYSNGWQQYSSNESLAIAFRLYKLVTETIPASEINYLLTNTKYELPDDGSTTEITVSKVWEGRPDGAYPESAQIILLQDGQPYGQPVTLNAQSGWTYTWTELPLRIETTDDSGGTIIREILYTVQEVAVTDYETTIEQTSESAFTVTNTWTPHRAAVVLQKMDAMDDSMLLPGAEFALYIKSTNGTGQEIPGTENVLGHKLEDVSILMGSDGTAVIPDLAVGETYYLVECQAPDGYNTLTEAVGFTITRRGTSYSLTLLSGQPWGKVISASGTAASPPVLAVRNQPGYALPETGGAGTTPYATGGLLLLLLSGLLLYNKITRRKEAAASP